MPLPPGLAEARRTIAIICAAVGLLALIGGVAYSFQETGDGCGSGWSAARKPLPSPLLTPQEIEAIQRERRNPYEAGIEKARPIRECRSAGARRLITAALGAGAILLPVGAVLGYLYWPRREELVDVIDISDDAVGEEPAPTESGGWGDWRRNR